MNENIELMNFTAEDSTENDIQEYHEIQDTTLDDVDTSFSSKHSTKPVNEFDFFTQNDVKVGPNKSLKKKKPKKAKSRNLMDIISSEIAAANVPIAENVMTFVDHSKEQQNSYLNMNAKTYKSVLRKTRSFFSDTESGWNGITEAVHLSPIFPRVLQNTAVGVYLIPTEYVPPSVFDDIIAKNSDEFIHAPTKFLDVTIQDIRFRHHHYFSLEKLLCMKVILYYKEYEFLNKLLKDVAYEIVVNRDTKDNLKKDLAKVSPSKKESIRFDQTVRKYTEKLIELKEKEKELLIGKKEVSHQIISLWADVEMVRERIDRIDTPYKLELQKSCLDDDQFRIKWNHIFNMEFTDKLDTIEYKYVNEYLEYKKIKHDHKLNSNNLIKPQLNIDETEIKLEAEELANNIMPKDQIELKLIKDESILSDFGKPNIRLIAYSFQFEIYVDDVFVCESEQYTTDDMFSVEYIESFSVQILPRNRSMKILLLENSNVVSNLNLDLDEIKKTSSNNDFKTENFMYSNTIEPNSKHVGSGYSIKEIAVANKVRLRSSSIFKQNLITTCEVHFKIGWNDKINQQNQSEAIKDSIEIGKQLKSLLNGNERPHLDTLINVISKIYEKDFDDENMIQTLEKLSKLEIMEDDCCSIDQANPELIRLKLLHLRNIGGFRNINDKLVPLHASQISTEQLNCLQKTNEKEFDMDYLNDKEMEMDPIEIQRFIGVKYVQKLNKNMMKTLNEFLLQKTHKDVVKETNISVRSFFKQSNVSSLATMSNSAKQQMLAESLCKEQDIRVMVLRAFNLHDRSSTILEEGVEDIDEIAGVKMRPLRPFVRISYKGVSAQTVTTIGCHPTWNHTLKIKTRLQPLSSIHVDVFDEYKAPVKEDFSEDERSSKTVHYRFYNKYLGSLQIPLYTVLSMGTIRGTFKITSPPLVFGYENLQTKESTSIIPEITQLMKKDTSFVTLEVATSLSHLGGLHAYSQPLLSSVEDGYLIKHLNSFVTEYTNEFPMRNISLTFIDSSGKNKCVAQFLQPVPLPDKAYFPKAQKYGSAISKSSGLSKSSSSSERRKDIDLERLNQEEKESLYMGSVHDEDSLAKLVNRCLRYVSLIPCYEMTESHVVSLLGVELLRVLYGSPVDHTLLLASYFIFLGIKCWVAVGLGLPRGRSSYVLIKYELSTKNIVLENDLMLRSRGFLNRSEGYSWYVCDACTGHRHELRDVGCPLKTVDYVFDNENIWVNRQISQDCENMSFDFTRSSEWQPVFDKAVFVMKQPIVTDELYSTPPHVEELRAALETKIKAKIQKWRSHIKTIWNRYCSTLLREMLPQWEYWSFNPTGPKPGFSQKLKQLMATYKIFGFPLNVAFTNTKAVVSAVKSSGVHATDDPNVEFALGVEMCAYPNNVISVWVFLATITRM